jgi:predicted amidohydrolase
VESKHRTRRPGEQPRSAGHPKALVHGDGLGQPSPPARPVTIAACSTPRPPPGLAPEAALEWNLAAAAQLVAQAAAQGAEIACLPEAFHRPGAEALPLEPLPDGPTARWCAALARHHRLHLIAPLIGRFEGAPRNTACWFDAQGRFAGAYAKVHLTTPELESGLVPGDAWPVFAIPCRAAGIVRAGVFICFDLNFPEAARLLALGGAELLFHPTVYSMYGETGWEAVLRARAIDNCVYLCVVNHGIRDGEPWMPGMSLGRSGVVGPDGLTLAETGRYAGVATATLDLARRRVVRSFGVAGEADFRHELWRHRRPETYAAIATLGTYLEEAGLAPAASAPAASAPAASAPAPTRIGTCADWLEASTRLRRRIDGA